RRAGDVPQAAHRLADHAEAGARRVGPGLAVARDADHHEPGIRLRERPVAHSPALERPGAEVLDEDVGARGELAGDRLSLGLAQVESDRALVARLDVPPDGRVVLEIAPLAQRVALA